jgi:hypothetical protein
VSKDLEGVTLWRVNGVMVEGVCELCQEPMRGQLCIGFGIVPEGRALILAVTDEEGAHPLSMVAEKHIPASVEIKA